jgi:hypothetical protein
VLAGFSRTYYRWMHDPRVQSAAFFVVLVLMFSGVLSIISGVTQSAGIAWAGVVGRLVGG